MPTCTVKIEKKTWYKLQIKLPQINKPTSINIQLNEQFNDSKIKLYWEILIKLTT